MGDKRGINNEQQGALQPLLQEHRIRTGVSELEFFRLTFDLDHLGLNYIIEIFKNTIKKKLLFPLLVNLK